MQTYLFYDIETTGLNKSFDQVLQFAAIRTDLELQELERHEIIIQLNSDIIPSPYALITHHIGLNDLQHGVNEFVGIQHIHTLLNTPGTISLGYNTLSFDDEFLRFSFYRNLLPPYSHQFANDCGRMDLYPMALMYYLFKPEVLNWPQLDGKPTLKLDQLNAANQLTTGRAHNAMVDVEATLALARRFIKERDMWDYLKGYFNKITEQDRLRPLQKNNIGLMIDGRLRDQAYQVPVLYLGQHRHYKNQFLWLQLDSLNLTMVTRDNIRETTRVTNKKYGEPNFILPLKDRFTTRLSTERRQLAETNLAWLTANPEQQQLIFDYYADYKYPTFDNVDIEASLYSNGFYNNDELQFCRSFHKASPAEKAALANKIRHPKIQALAIRILGRHFADAMTPSQSEQFHRYLQQVNAEQADTAIIDFQGNPRTTPNMALHEIAVIRTEKQLSQEQETLLNELENYLVTRFAL